MILLRLRLLPLEVWYDGHISAGDGPSQKELQKSGRRTGRLTVAMPTMISRLPQALMVIADGKAERVRTTRKTAAVITKTPEERRRPMMSFLVLLDESWTSDVKAYLWKGIWSFQRRGIGMQRMRASVLQ